MKEAKKGVCTKCNIYFYMHEHHILPKSIFGKKGKTVLLCPNCHTHFHEYSKQHTTNPTDENEAMEIWTTWLKNVSIAVSILILACVFACRV
jgi:Zn-finger protein